MTELTESGEPAVTYLLNFEYSYDDAEIGSSVHIYDEKLFGEWWNVRRSPQFPDTDQSEIIAEGNCMGS